jgi:vacuolar-type H+-ATPase subunit E/Vma4
VSELDPLRAAALRQARVEAEALEVAARAAAAATVADAEARAAALVEARRADARALARLRGERTRAQGRRQANGTLMRARRDAYEALRHHAHQELGELPRRPEHAALVERLEHDARRRLGTPRIEPAPDGGILATAGTRRLDYSLAARLERCLAALGEELEALWA